MFGVPLIKTLLPLISAEIPGGSPVTKASLAPFVSLKIILAGSGSLLQTVMLAALDMSCGIETASI